MSQAFELTLIDRAAIDLRRIGVDLAEAIDHHLNYRPPERRVVIRTPNLFMLASVETIHDPWLDPTTVAPYWFIAYAIAENGTPLKEFVKVDPIVLDFAGFYRQTKDTKPRFRYLDLRKMRRNTNH